MPEFLHPSLLALGLPLLALPIIIHLINLMRHRRIEWAAMEFLLESQKKNSTWVLLKQLILLLLRILAIAAIVFIVAQPFLQDQWGKLFGGTRTHHIVLLDDSLSMADRAADKSAFDNGKRFIANLVTQGASRPEPQTFSMMRFSRSGPLSRGRPPDFLKEGVNKELVLAVESKLGSFAVSETSAGPDGALEAIEQVLGEADDENRIVYLVSDFRARDWEDATALNKALADLNAAKVEVRLIHCVDAARPNLAITSLKAMPGTRAAGVPLFMELAVTNYGSDPVKNVAINLEENGKPRAGESIEEIKPGRTETKRFMVHFPTAGEHRVKASLGSDAVELDNHRYAVVDFPIAVPVLLVDGDPGAGDAFFLNAALSPGTVRTGIASQIELPRFLSTSPLEKFQTIYLTNVDRMDVPAVENLEKFVTNGGGVAFFLGDLVAAKFYNDQLYREGKGLFPVPLIAPTELLVNRLEKTADLDVADHPIFKIFAGERNSFLGDVSIVRYFEVPATFAPKPDSTTQILARMRNNAPLAIEHKFGQGRVIVFLTTAGPAWNNWVQNPSYVVTIHELQAYLSSSRPVSESRVVASPVELQLDPARYQPQVRFIAPADGDAGGTSVDASPKSGVLEATFAETDASGVYGVELTTSEGAKEVRRFAVNVPAEEGDLKTIKGEQLSTRLKGVKFEYQQAENYQYAAADQAGFHLSEGILYLMIVLLIGEQLLAYSASYHLPVKAGAA